mgnify:CR=1 FL=1
MHKYKIVTKNKTISIECTSDSIYQLIEFFASFDAVVDIYKYIENDGLELVISLKESIKK